jgi:O6-methylguanine-DNA--protein-cysteine methyltransferase
MANSKNPAQIIIPCHRVIGSNNTLTGYAGGLEMKKTLLQLEQEENFNNSITGGMKSLFKQK